MSYRIELDLTQTQLAQRINAKQKSISRYETGASLPSIKPWLKSPKSSKNQLDISWMSKAKKSKTTEIYTFVSRKFLGKIKSPLDTIKGSEYCIQK